MREVVCKKEGTESNYLNVWRWRQTKIIRVWVDGVFKEKSFRARERGVRLEEEFKDTSIDIVVIVFFFLR